MASKKHSHSTPRLARPRNKGTVDVLVEQIRSLRLDLATARAHEAQLLDIIAEKDAQIRMVLESRFYRPIVTSSQPPPENDVHINAETLRDSPVFDADADKRQLAEEDRAVDEAKQRLERELEGMFDELAQEQVAAHGATETAAPATEEANA